jgi:hypothetical protein
LVVARSITADDVLEVLAVLMIQRGVPDHIRSANEPQKPVNCFTSTGIETRG